MRRWTEALIVALAISACGSSTGGGPSTVAQVASPAAAARAAQQGFHAFQIFRRAPRKKDAIPVDQAVGGVKPTLSRLAYGGPFGTLYAYIHNGLICVSYGVPVSPSAGAGTGRCDSVPAATESGIALTIPATFDHLDRLALLVPDGVKTVTITRVDGSSATVSVTSNAVVNAGPGLRGWSFTTLSGNRQSQLMRPAGAKPVK